MRLLALSLIFSLVGSLSAQAQSVTGCERKQTEEEYQKCIERSGGNQGFDPQDWGAGTVTPPTQDPIPQDKKDQLPPESQQQISREMAKKVYAQVPEWTPQTRNQEFEYEPSEAAKSDADLKAREEAAFAEAVSKYHAREQKAYDARQGGGAGTGDGTGDGEESGAGGGNGNVSVGGDVNAPDAGKGGQAGGDPNGQSRSAMDILGDLNVIGDPSGNSDGTQGGDGSGGGEGERQVIAGDVTIGSPQGGAGEQSGGQSGGQGPEGQTGDSGQAGPAGEDQAGAGEAASQVTDGQKAGGQEQTADQPTQSVASGSDSAAQQPPGSAQENPAGTTGTPSDQASAEQASQQQSPADAQQEDASGAPGEPSTSTPPRNADGPPPAPSRPIPPADPIAAAILASLFDDAEDSGGEDGQPSAPFIDWTDPDAAEKIKDAASVIAEDTPPAAPSTLTLPADQNQAARVLDKEEARIAYQEATLADAALSADAKADMEQQVTARKDALAEASAQVGPIPSPQGARMPPQANARLSKMTLP